MLAVIPARGGSKGLPGKNIRPLGGIPLIAHSIRAASMIEGVTRCIVSTDSAEIADIARAHRGDVPFLRAPELAQDDTPMAPVLAHALRFAEEEECEKYDALLLLDPTSPVRVPNQIAKAVEQLMSTGDIDGVISISEPTFNPSWVGVSPTTEGNLTRYYQEAIGVTRRQDAQRYLRINGNFYLWKSEFVRRMAVSWFDEGTHAGVEIPESQSFAIDYEYEFELIETLLNSGFIKLPWLGSEAVSNHCEISTHL